jgi:nitroreductase
MGSGSVIDRHVAAATFGRGHLTQMTTNEPLAFIFGRRSIRVYSPGEIGESAVQTLLEAAMAAPSAMAKDPWRFVVVREGQMLARLAKALPGGQMLAAAAMGIVVAGDLEAAMEQDMGYLVQDCTAAIENLLLCAQVLGLGACWVGVYPSEESTRQVRALLALPGKVVPIAVISLGHPGEKLPARTRYQAQYVHFEMW